MKTMNGLYWWLTPLCSCVLTISCLAAWLLDKKALLDIALTPKTPTRKRDACLILSPCGKKEGNTDILASVFFSTLHSAVN